ncbi:MAG: hypothetical protein ACTHMI_13715 [Mucilaginibacter sp.]
MKEENEFLKKMETLKVPEVNPAQHPGMVKMAIMNAQRSAALGVWLIIVPCYFLLCVLMYYYFHIKAGWFGSMFTLIAGLENIKGMDFFAPVIFLLLPVICIIINALAITHVSFQRMDTDRGKARELNITIKIKMLNIVLILISIAILFAFLSFAMTESISIKN